MKCIDVFEETCMHGTLGIVVAMASEANALFGRSTAWARQRELQAITLCEDDSSLLVICSGIGRQRACDAAERLISQNVSALMSIGLAGGLDPSLKVGSVLVASHVQCQDEKTHLDTGSINLNLCDCIHTDLQQGGADVVCGTVLTVDTPVSSIDQKRLLFKQTGAHVVDMECSAVVAVACRAKIPLIGIKVVCDDAKVSLPTEMLHWLDPNGCVLYRKMLRSIIKQPLLGLDMLAMARRFGIAQRSLKRCWRQLRSTIPSFEGVEDGI